MDADQREHVRRESDGLPRKHVLAAEVEAGVVAGFDRVFNDPVRCKRIGESLFNVMFDHSKETTSKWIGSRILTWFFTVVAIAALGWLAKNGVLTK